MAREDQIFLEDGLGMSSSERVDASENVSEKFLKKVNERFNKELGRLTEENAQGVILNIGKPGVILRSAGISNKPIRLYGNKLLKKMRKHGLDTSDVKDLPVYINNPIAVFNNYGNERNRAVLTEIKTSQGNILATIEWGKGSDAEINIVTSVFGKGEDNIVDRLNKDYARYINKSKALDYLHHSDRHISEALCNPRLVSAAKVVENFKIPRFWVKMLVRLMEKMSRYIALLLKLTLNIRIGLMVRQRRVVNIVLRLPERLAHIARLVSGLRRILDWVLSQEEIQKLMDTYYQFEKENVRNAFIFCLYTGMRFCDVKDLRYSNIDYANKLLRFEQDKTKGHSALSWVTIPLNDGLIHLVGRPKEGETKESLVFNLPSYESCCKSVKRWVKRAGIDKHISWHCAYIANGRTKCEKALCIFVGSDAKQGVRNTKSAKNEILFNINLGSLTNYVYFCTCK